VTEELQEILICQAGSVCFGVPVSAVQEILRAVALTPLPNAPPHVEGVISLRGRVLPVVDVRRRFCLPTRPPEPSDHFVVVRLGECLAVLRTDRAIELKHLDAAAVDNAPRLPQVSQVATLPDGLVFIHDLQHFLAPEGEEVLT
jgi:purine-binding chemotaxis protein CheW